MRTHSVWRAAALLSMAALAAVALLKSVLLAPSVALLPHMQRAADHSSGAWQVQQQYQDRIITETAMFRPNGSDANSLFSRFWHHWRQERANGTYMGKRIFIPMNVWECVYKCDKESRADWQMGPYIHNLNRNFTYFMITGMDKGLHMWGAMTPLPADMDLLVFYAGGVTRGARNIALPLLRHIPSPKGLAKDVTVSAAMWIGSHGMRSIVNETWHSWGLQDGFVWASGLSHEEYDSLLERSNFTLAPRGNGVSSFRMFEALRVGTIPIYIWKYTLMLPFAELIDWDTIAVVMEVHQMDKLLDVIRNFDVAKAQRIMAAMRHMWTYEYVNTYVVGRLATEHQGLPISKAAFADDPGCDCAPGCGGQC